MKVGYAISLVVVFAVFGFMHAALSTAASEVAEEKHMDEDLLCQKLEDSYKRIKNLEKERGIEFLMQVERMSYLVLAAGIFSNGSERLDVIFAKIQKELPLLVVPHYVMMPDELGKFIAGIAHDEEKDLRPRCMAEWVSQAKEAITHRSGFTFDPSLPVIRTQ